MRRGGPHNRVGGRVRCFPGSTSSWHVDPHVPRGREGPAEGVAVMDTHCRAPSATQALQIPRHLPHPAQALGATRSHSAHGVAKHWFPWRSGHCTLPAPLSPEVPAITAEPHTSPPTRRPSRQRVPEPVPSAFSSCQNEKDVDFCLLSARKCGCGFKALTLAHASSRL